MDQDPLSMTWNNSESCLNSSSLFEANCSCLSNTNSTDNSAEDEDSSIDIYDVLDVVWTVIYSAMLIVAISGNAIVMWIVTAHRRMWNVTNSFIVNLSIADLLNSALNCAFAFSFMKSGNWVFGKTLCTVNHFVAYSTICASGFTLSAISLDRHISILRPNKPHISSGCAAFILVMVWLLSILVAVPPAIFTGFETVTKEGKSVSYCFLMWPDGPQTSSFYDYAYNIFFTVLVYVVPMLQMLVSYTHMSIVLWSKHLFMLPTPANNTNANSAQADSKERRDSYLVQQTERAIVNKRKLVKMFITVVVVFGLCWLPYHGYFLYTYHDQDIVSNPAIQHVYLGFYWLAMANSMINPIIYYFMNARFRFYFRALMMRMKHWFCGRWIAVDVSTSFELDHMAACQLRPNQANQIHQHQQQLMQQQHNHHQPQQHYPPTTRPKRLQPQVRHAQVHQLHPECHKNSNSRKSSDL